MSTDHLKGVFEARFLAVVKGVFARRRDYYIDSLARRIIAVGGTVVGEKGKTNTLATWTKISSLSGLRTLVGGRFANLKERWMAVGFPLRDASEEGVKGRVNRAAWLELANWIEGQGYAARLPEDSSDGTLLEVRPLRDA